MAARQRLPRVGQRQQRQRPPHAALALTPSPMYSLPPPSFSIISLHSSAHSLCREGRRAAGRRAGFSRGGSKDV